MKIVIGKFSNEPFHALSKKEVSLLFKVVPSEWAEHVSSVVLSSKIFKKTKLIKPVEYIANTKQLSVYSRGLVREYIARQVLLELALIVTGHQEVSSDKTVDLNMMVKPYMDKFLKARI
jgi:hypothetical protein